jgi:hypothetical protein
MIIERTESPQWTSNAYLVADRQGGRGILIDGNGLVEPLIARAQERRHRRRLAGGPVPSAEAGGAR